MTIRKILTEPDPFLRQKSEDVIKVDGEIKQNIDEYALLNQIYTDLEDKYSFNSDTSKPSTITYNEIEPINNYETKVENVLLHNNPDQREWRSWAKMIGLRDLPFDRGQFFDVDDAAIQAATTGLGIALGELFLIKKDIIAGRLVAPFKNSEVKTGDYHLAWHEANDNKSSILLFREWLLHEISQPSTT